MMQRFSLLLNVVLIASLAVALPSRRKHAQGSAPSAQLLPQAAPERLDNSNGTIPTEQPFRWSQIESPDYRVYVANLRGIGCPEQTVRDIIRADVGSLYAAKRKELHIDQQSARGRWSRDEESRLVASLL